jgi:hypothetical protein
VNRKTTLALGAGGAMVAIGLAAMFALGGRCGGGTTTENIYRAWYFDTSGGPVVVVSHGSHFSGVHTGEPRYDTAASSTMRLYGHRLADGSYLGSQSADWLKPADGNRFWVIDKTGPRLVAAESMKVVADRAAIAEAAGGDFELTRPGGFVHPYDGWLAVKMADGKDHWVTPALEHRAPDAASRIPPEGWYCSIGRNDLIEPRLAECLPPAAAPATGLFLSRQSALDKDQGLAPLVSGVAASYQETRVLWTKSLVDLVDGEAEPSWMGAQVVGPRRVLVMVRTAGMKLHLVTVDPVDGSVRERAVLFDESPPGP